MALSSLRLTKRKVWQTSKRRLIEAYWIKSGNFSSLKLIFDTLGLQHQTICQFCWTLHLDNGKIVRPFHFEAMWTNDEESSTIVEKDWNT